MSGAELLCLNLTETRRRSIRIWRAIPLALEADYLYGQMLRERRSHSGDSPFADRHFDDLDAALAFANPYRESLLETVLGLSGGDLNTIAIDRSDIGYIRKAGELHLANRISRSSSR